MKHLLSVMLLAWLLHACAAPEGNKAENSSRLVIYDCTNADSLSVRFYSDRQSADLLHRGVSIELQQRTTGSGFLYSNGPNTIRGNGDDLVVEIGRMAPLRCHAR
ncbi:MAG: MliC family protein [Candidatus Thiodiazotropha sp.]